MIQDFDDLFYLSYLNGRRNTMVARLGMISNEHIMRKKTLFSGKYWSKKGEGKILWKILCARADLPSVYTKPKNATEKNFYTNFTNGGWRISYGTVQVKFQLCNWILTHFRNYDYVMGQPFEKDWNILSFALKPASYCPLMWAKH